MTSYTNYMYSMPAIFSTNRMYVENNPFIINMQMQATALAAQYQKMREASQKFQAQMAEAANSARTSAAAQYYNNNTTLRFNTVQTSAAARTSLANRTSVGYNTSIYTAANATGSKNGQKLNRNSSQYGPEFLAKVKQIAQRLNCNYRDLLALMNAESGINASAKNPYSSATGLIQFIDSTAKSLGTTVEQLRVMSPIDQLDYVEKYLQRAKASAGFGAGEYLSGGQLYALTLYPAKARNEVLITSGGNAYSMNKGLDLNKDGQITKSELDARMKRFYVSDNSFLA